MRALLCAILSTGLVTACATARVDEEPVDDSLRLVVLGTGNPNADPERSGPALAIVKGEHAYLIDAGAGVVRRAAAAAQRHDITALTASKLDTLLLTHLHSDHTVGLPDLIFTPWVLTREAPLKVYGPIGTAAMVGHLEAAYTADIHMRLDGLEPANDTGYKAEVVEIEAPGVVLENDDLVIEAFPVLHGSWPQAFGYKVSDGETTIVVSGDARPSPALVEAARGADILIHEVYSTEGYATRAPEWQTYHASFHTSTRELAAIAAEAQPRLLVLYHQLYWGVTDADLVREVHEAGYGGAVVSARDLDVY